MRAETEMIPNPHRPLAELDATTREEAFIPFQTPVLLSSSEGIVLGVSTWVTDGEIFVATNRRLPPETEVEISLVTPGEEKMVRASGHVTFLHEASASSGPDRSGIGVAVDSIVEFD